MQQNKIHFGPKRTEFFSQSLWEYLPAYLCMPISVTAQQLTNAGSKTRSNDGNDTTGASLGDTQQKDKDTEYKHTHTHTHGRKHANEQANTCTHIRKHNSMLARKYAYTYKQP